MRLNDDSTPSRDVSRMATKGPWNDTLISVSNWRVCTLSATLMQATAVLAGKFSNVSSCNLCAWKVISRIPNEEKPGRGDAASRSHWAGLGWGRSETETASSLSAGDGRRGRCAVGPQPYVLSIGVAAVPLQRYYQVVAPPVLPPSLAPKIDPM